MSLAENKGLVRRHYQEVLTAKKLEVVDEIYADPVRVGDEANMPRAQFRQLAGLTHAAFPDLAVTVEDQIAEGDKVVTRFSRQGDAPRRFHGDSRHRQAGHDQGDSHPRDQGRAGSPPCGRKSTSPDCNRQLGQA